MTQIHQLVMPQDAQEAQRLVEEIAATGLAVHGHVIRFDKNLEGIDSLDHAFHLHSKSAKSFERLQQLIEKRRLYEIGYKQGVADTRRSVPELAAALQGSTFIVIQGASHEAR